MGAIPDRLSVVAHHDHFAFVLQLVTLMRAVEDASDVAGVMVAPTEIDCLTGDSISIPLGVIDHLSASWTETEIAQMPQDVIGLHVLVDLVDQVLVHLRDR